jgi:hypothetical protein
MRKPAFILIAAVLTGLLVGVVIASSGGDDGSSGDAGTVPELTVPGDSNVGDTRTERDRDRGTTGDSGTAGESQPSPETGGSGDAGGDGTGGSAAPQDTEQNDVPPPADSPAQRFENFCEQNPGAC